VQNICIYCHADDVPMAVVEGESISACHHCGTVYIPSRQLIIRIDTELQSPLYSLARALSEIYKLAGSMKNLPTYESEVI